MNKAPDPDMSKEQQAVADSLSPEVVANIDKTLLSHARPLGRKIAMLVGLTMMDNSLRVPDLPDIFYAQRVRHLIESGLLLAEGDINTMGMCEVRLP